MSDDFRLAAEFPPSTRDDWRRLVEAALKGASFDKKLVGQTYDGLRTEPLYARAAGAKPVTGRTPGAAWTLMQRVTTQTRRRQTNKPCKTSKTARPG